MSARTYIATFAAIALTGLALIAALGIVVDAYGVFGTRLIPASRFPPQLRLIKHGDRVTKAIEIAERRGDEILFVGDSRTFNGLDPDSPALSGLKAYNAALAAATIAEQVVELDYSLAHEPGVKRIVWGLSLEAFPFGIPTTSDYPDSAFAGNSILSGLLRHLFAYERVTSSWKTLLQSRKLVRATMKRNGVAFYDRDPIEGPAIAGPFERELQSTSRGMYGPMSQDAIDAAQAKLKDRLIALKAAGIDVDLVLLPVHIWRLEFFRQADMEPQFEAWKRQIATTAAELATAPGSGKLRLFDFARPHHLVEESIYFPPPLGERRYYRETSHFYPWLGDKVLATVFGVEPDMDTRQAKAFGREIGDGAGSISIDQDLATTSAALDAWEATHPDDVSHVKKLISR
jgi:hypothetical protein